MTRVYPTTQVAARMTLPDGGEVLRTCSLESYDLEVLADDVRRLARGARVEVTVRGSDDEIADVRAQLSWAARRGIEVAVDRPAAIPFRLPRTAVAPPPPPAPRPPDVGDVVRTDALGAAVWCRVIAVEPLRVPAGVLRFLTLEPCDGAPAGVHRMVRLSDAVSRAGDEDHDGSDATDGGGLSRAAVEPIAAGFA